MIEYQSMTLSVFLMKKLHVEIKTWVSTGKKPTGSIIVEEGDSTMVPNVPSILMVAPSMHGGRSRLSSRGTYK